MNKKWELLLSKFRSLGGIAENILQKEGKDGRSIFSINPNQRSRVFIPPKLMIKKEDIFLESNKLRIKENVKYSKEIREFFNYYQDNFSWGSGGREITETFEKGLSLFSPELKYLINKYISVDIDKRHLGVWDEIILKEFLNSRAFQYKSYSMICPVLELFNHDAISLPFINHSNGISTPNYEPISGEFRFNYNKRSSIQRFFYQGFFSKETIVFSFPFSIDIKNLSIKFICKGKDIINDFIKIERTNKNIYIEGLPIADGNNKNLPIKYFEEVLKRLKDFDIPKEIFKEIIELNISNRKMILDKTYLINNEVSKLLARVINYEVNLISSYD